LDLNLSLDQFRVLLVLRHKLTGHTFSETAEAAILSTGGGGSALGEEELPDLLEAQYAYCKAVYGTRKSETAKLLRTLAFAPLSQTPEEAMEELGKFDIC
jgi:hypothetical protein